MKYVSFDVTHADTTHRFSVLIPEHFTHAVVAKALGPAVREMFPKASKIKVSTAGFADVSVHSTHGLSTSLGKNAKPADPKDAIRMEMASYSLNIL